MDIKQNIHKGSKVGHFEASLYVWDDNLLYMGYSSANQTCWIINSESNLQIKSIANMK